MQQEQPAMSKEEFRQRFDEWRQKTYELFQRWQQEEGLTVEQCLARFWGKELLEKWSKL